MSTSVSDLIRQREELERQIRDAQASIRSNAIARVRELMTEHGLTVADLVAKATLNAGASAKTKVAAKYRDPQSGLTWSGRGLRPRWLVAAINEGKSLSDFAL